MRIERTDKEILIRIPANLSSKKLQDILDLLRYSELTAKSSATQQDADNMASDINMQWWSKNRDRLIK